MSFLLSRLVVEDDSQYQAATHRCDCSLVLAASLQTSLETSSVVVVRESESASPQFDGSSKLYAFDLTDCGVRLAYASAAKPIHRRTAERVLAEFMERVRTVPYLRLTLSSLVILTTTN
jgi:hypothetical protein